MLSTPSVIHLRLEQDLHKYCVAPFHAMKTKHTDLREKKRDKLNSRFRKILQLNKKVPQRIAMNTIQRIAPFCCGENLGKYVYGGPQTPVGSKSDAGKAQVRTAGYLPHTATDHPCYYRHGETRNING